MMAEGIHFGNGDTLRRIDTRMAAEIIGGKTGDGIIQQVVRAEQFHTHDGAGNGCIGGSGKHGNKAQAGHEVYRGTAERPEGIAECCANKEERGNLSSFKSGTKGDGGE